MWLFNFNRNKYENETRVETIQDNKADNESKDKLQLIKDEADHASKFVELQNLIQDVQITHEKLQVIKEKRNLNTQDSIKIQEDKNIERNVSLHENEKVDKTNDFKIEAILKSISNLENNFQTLNDKVNNDSF